MNKKIIVTIAAIMVMGLAAVAFAYQHNTATSSVAMASCCKGDSCPMKTKEAKAGKSASCCDNCDCCTGDSCPMKKKGEASAMKMADGKACPMMKTEDTATTSVSLENTKVVVVKGDEGCCCSCCGGKEKAKADAPAV